MKVYALLATIGDTRSYTYELYGVTHAGTLEMACKKFGVTPTPTRSAYCREALKGRLPLPPKAKDPEFVQVDATDGSAAELGHVLSIPRLHGFMINAGAWVCELPTLD
ncbi:MAG TPA: hypothetical protein VJ694_00650 [Patescibacteria group bacterium]|nr:hypothetical protein [Patescibacteria group bacterium]